MPRLAFSVNVLGTPHGRITAADRLRLASHGFFKVFNANTPGLRANLIVTGSAASGGETLRAVPAQGSATEVLIGSAEKNVSVLVEMAPEYGPGETDSAVAMTIKQVAANGAVTPDVSATFLASLAWQGTKILFSLGTATAKAQLGSSYTVTLAVTSTEDVTRQVVVIPIVCRS